METEHVNILVPIPIADHLWFLEILIGLAVLVGINYLFKKVVKHVRQRSLSKALDWRERLNYILFLPVHILLWILGVILVLEVTARRFEFSFFDGYLSAFRATGVVCVLAWVLLRWKKEMQHTLLNKDRAVQRLDAGFVHVLGKFLTIIVMIIAAMIILQLWGLDIGPLIAFGGIGAAGVAFASKDVIANFFGGLMLYITRPFMVGDQIVISERKLEGYVEEIGWYLTCVRDKEKRPVYLPNAIFSSGLVINNSRMTHRRIEQKIGVRFEDFSNIAAIADGIRASIAAHPAIDNHLPVLVVFNGFNEYTLDLYIDVYTLSTRYDQFLAVKQEVLMLAYDAILKQGGEVPCPLIQIKTELSSLS
jgi:MscS family membrane protein